MKHQPLDISQGKPHTRRKTPRFAPLIALTVLLTIPLYYYPSIRDSSKKLYETTRAFESLEDPLPISGVTSTPKDDNDDVESSNVNLPQNDDNGDIKPVNENGDIKPSSTNTLPNDDNEDIKPCLDEEPDSPRCHGDGGDVVVQQHKLAPPARKRGKIRHKRPRKSQTNLAKDSRAEESVRHATTRRGSDRSSEYEMIRSSLLDDEKCDIFTGEWVPNPEGPYYTNATCDAIQEHQNCLKFGRPDRGFLKWRWKPDDCELPIFYPTRFLELVSGKSIAFVGDSVARNHMQSLICLLSRVAHPVDLSDPWAQNKRYEFREHDFNISMFWAPYLVRTTKTDSNDDKRPFKLYLDEFDPHWTYNITTYNYVVISAGHWFFRPTYFYLKNKLVGCLYCPESNINHLTSYFSYRRAFRTAFRAINEASGFNGITFLRTYAPSHFEGARWDKGGDCVQTKPFKRNETVLKDYSLEMYLIQLEELRIAQKAGRGNGWKFRLFDATKLMLLRPDGHPSKYGHWPEVNQTFAKDCVHWCLPGPIDSWNDFFQELLEREIGDSNR